MDKIVIFIFIFLLLSCQGESKSIPNNFKTGYFKTVLDDDKTVSFANRNDTIQIETYNNKKDTFKIKWIGNFEYVLVKKNPESLLDSTPFHVKITAVKKKSYSFRAYYKGSNFTQNGKAYKIE
jgi:hypothetical protein